MTGSIKEKLAGTTSVASLSLEEEIRRSLDELGWNAVHSAYFTDVASQKMRELDVVASKRWRKKGGDETSMGLSLLVECKSMDGFHIVFSETNPRMLQFQVTGLCAWPGYLPYSDRRAIADALAEFGYGPRELTEVFSEIEKTAYPEDTVRVFDLILKPYPEEVAATSYRETNIGTDKDLDNSVLWRAIQAVHSAAKSLKIDSRNAFVSDLSGSAMLAERNDLDRIDALRGTINRRTQIVDIFHPIVVVNAQLWVSSNGTLAPIEWGRFYQHDAKGHVKRWCDVVHFDSVAAYFKEMTEHYFLQATAAIAQIPEQ